MLKKYAIAGILLCSTLNISASELELLKESKKYASLKELCLKIKENSPYARSRIMLRWKSGKCKFRYAKKEMKPYYEKYNLLAPYVISTMHPGNIFFKLDGFSNYRYKRQNNGSYTIRLSNKNIKKHELGDLYAQFSQKFKKINFETKKQVRNISEQRESIRKTHEVMHMSSGGIDDAGRRKLKEDLREAIPTTHVWDATTYKSNSGTIIFKVLSIITPENLDISGHVKYIVD